MWREFLKGGRGTWLWAGRTKLGHEAGIFPKSKDPVQDPKLDTAFSHILMACFDIRWNE